MTVDANTITNQHPKQTIKPRLHTDQVDISDNDCADLDCDKASGKMVGCRSKVSLVRPLAGSLLEIRRSSTKQAERVY